MFGPASENFNGDHSDEAWSFLSPFSLEAIPKSKKKKSAFRTVLQYYQCRSANVAMPIFFAVLPFIKIKDMQGRRHPRQTSVIELSIWLNNYFNCAPHRCHFF